MSKQNWNRALFFALGTFFGGWVLRIGSQAFGKFGRRA